MEKQIRRLTAMDRVSKFKSFRSRHIEPFKVSGKYPGRFIFSTFDLRLDSNKSESDFPKTNRNIRECENGAKGMKVYKNFVKNKR
jgi:hypothetical protein